MRYNLIFGRLKKRITMKNIMIISLFSFLSFINSPSYATIKVDPQDIPPKCSKSFEELQYVRTLRTANPGFPSLKIIAARREAAFLACLQGKEQPETDLQDYDINQPDVVVW
jgi:hypothetical protein